jgi:RHS repeat-associated protein
MLPFSVFFQHRCLVDYAIEVPPCYQTFEFWGKEFGLSPPNSKSFEIQYDHCTDFVGGSITAAPDGEEAPKTTTLGSNEFRYSGNLVRLWRSVDSVLEDLNDFKGPFYIVTKSVESSGGAPGTSSFKASWRFAQSGNIYRLGVKWYAGTLAACTELSSIGFHYDVNDDIYEYSSSTRRQLRVWLGGLADAVKSGNTLTLSFYDESQIGEEDENGMYPVTGTPVRRAVITNTGSAVTYKRYEGTALTGDWILTGGTSPESFTIQDVVGGYTEKKITGTELGDRYEIDEVWHAGQLVSSVKSVYHMFDWGEELIKTVNDPDGAALTTTYSYETNASNPGYGYQLTAQYPDGSWTRRQYANLPSGVTAITWKPVRNTAMPASTPASGWGYVKEVSYTDGRQETYTDGYLTRKSQTITGTGSFGGVSGADKEQSIRWFNTGANDKLTTITYSYPATQSYGFRAGRTLGIVRPDGACSKFGYFKGTYNISTGVFTENSTGTDIMEVEWRGRVNAAGTDQEWIANQSTSTGTVSDKDGNVLEETEYVYDGSTFGNAMSRIRHTYDANGNLVESKRDGVIIYTATYDAQGNLDSSSDEFGVTTTVTQSGRTTTVRVNDGTPNVTSGGQPGRVTTSTVDVAGRTLSETTDGLTTSYAYAMVTGGGRKVTATLPSGATSIREYYRDGRLMNLYGSAEVYQSHSYAAGTGETYQDSYTDQDRTTYTIRDMLGRIKGRQEVGFEQSYLDTYYTYSPATGQLTKIQRGSSSVLAPQAFEYDSMGRRYRSGVDMDATAGLQTASTSDRITETETAYELISSKWNEVTRTYQYIPTSTRKLMQTIKRQMDGRKTIVELPDRTLTTTITSVNRTTRRTYVSELDSRIGSAAQRTYAGNNTLLEIRSPEWAYQTHAYNAQGRLQSVNDFEGRTTSFLHHPHGQLGAGQVSQITLPGNRTVTRTYTAMGLVNVEEGTGTYWKDFDYDQFGDLVTLKTRRNGSNLNTTTWEREWYSGLVQYKRDSGGLDIAYGYDEYGLLRTRIWTRGTTTTYGYNKAGEVNSISYSDGTPGASNMNYDRAGRLTSVTDASGTRSITYSDYGERAVETYTGSGVLSGTTVTRTFNATTGLRATLSATRNAATIFPSQTYSYTNKLISGVSQGPLVASISYQSGTLLPNWITLSGGGGQDFHRIHAWNLDGQPTGIENRYDDGIWIDIHGYPLPTDGPPIDYDTAGRIAEIPRMDGDWEYGYNTRNEVTSGLKRFSNNNPVPGHQFTYTFDDIGNRSAAAAGGDHTGANLSSISYTPMVSNKYSAYTTPSGLWITGEADSSVTVTVNGSTAWRNGPFFARQISVLNSSAPVWQQITVQAGSTTEVGFVLVAPANVSPTYDSDGNLTADGLWSYAWDGENRLKSVTSLTTVPVAARRKLEFAYDFEGRRVSKKVYTWNTSMSAYNTTPITSLLYIYDGWNLIAEIDLLDLDNDVLRQYVWGPDLSGTLQGAGGVGGLLGIYDFPEGRLYKVLYGTNGNVSRLVAADDDSIAASYEYGPFGELLRASGSYASQNPFRFSTKFQDNETGLVYYGHRYYHPTLGRWLSRDPIEEDGGYNLYAFAGNNPINFFDPFGLATYEFKGGTEKQRNTVREAADKAMDYVRRASSDLDRYDENHRRLTFFPRGRFVEWFGEFEQARYQTVKDNYDSLVSLYDDTIKFDLCPAQKVGKDTAAWVYFGGDVEIFIAPRFWKLDKRTQIKVVIHETTHEAFGSKDHIYGASASRNLARTDPETAIWNADNYSYHAME